MSKKAWSPGRSSRSEKVCGCGLQRSPEIALIASTLLGAELEEHLHRSRDDLGLAHAGAEHPVDLLVGRVDDPGRLIEERELVGALDLACLEHHGLRVGDLQALALEREERRHVGHVHPDRLGVEAALVELRPDQIRERVGHAGRVGHRTAHRGNPRAP